VLASYHFGRDVLPLSGLLRDKVEVSAVDPFRQCDSKAQFAEQMLRHRSYASRSLGDGADGCMASARGRTDANYD
jgi:hypothetical protein